MKLTDKKLQFLPLVKGNTYRFNQDDSSNDGHPLKLYDDANKTTEYTTGVTISGTAGTDRYLEITVALDAPSSLHYQCTEHSGMGAQINIVDHWVYTESLTPLKNNSVSFNDTYNADTSKGSFGAHVHLEGDNTIICAWPTGSEPGTHSGTIYMFNRTVDENGDDVWSFFDSFHSRDIYNDDTNDITRMGSPAFAIDNKYIVLSRKTGGGYGTALRAFKKNNLGYYVQIPDPTKDNGNDFQHGKNLRLLGDRLISSDSFFNGPQLVVWDLSGDSNEKNPNKPVGVSKTITIDQDSTYTFLANDLSGNDGDGHAITKFKITQLPSKGTLKLSGTNVTNNQDIVVGDVTNLTYTPADSGYGNTYTTILYKANDGQDYGENNAIITFNVTQDQNQAEAESSGIASNKINKIKQATIAQNGAEHKFSQINLLRM